MELLSGGSLRQATIDSLREQLKTLHKRIAAFDELTGEKRQSKSTFDLADLVDELLSNHCREFERHGIAVTFERPDAPFMVKAVRGMVIQILENLIVNAAYWLKQQKRFEPGFAPRLAIVLDAADRSLTVEDNGPGVTDDRRERIFQPFITSKPTGQGRGLGLYIARELAEYHKWKLTMDTDVGRIRNLRALVAEKVNWQSESFKQIDDQELSKGIEGAFEGPSVPIARLFQRVRVDEHEKGARVRHRLGDMFIKPDEKRVMVVITPDCDLVPRGTGPKVKRVLTMDGELRSFDQESASADQFIFYKDKAFSLKWNPKTLNTFAVSGAGSLGSLAGVEFLGTLRPLYAQEVQRLALTDLGRIGLAVAPTMGVDAAVTVHLRTKTENGSRFEVLEVPGSATATVLPERGDLAKGHRVLLRRSYIHTLVEKLKDVAPATLLPEDAKKLADFLREKNEELLISGFLIKGAATKDIRPSWPRPQAGRTPGTSTWCSMGRSPRWRSTNWTWAWTAGSSRPDPCSSCTPTGCPRAPGRSSRATSTSASTSSCSSPPSPS